MDFEPIEGEVQPLSKRGISMETCKRNNYQIGTVPKDHMSSMAGQKVHIENYYDEDGHLCGQKLRNSKKDFIALGRVSDRLFGMHKVKPGGSKVLVITEGAIDAMSYEEMRSGWWAVSIPNGASGAAKAIKANLEDLEKFEKVVLCFDNDEAGQAAIDKVKGILSPGKAHIAALPQQYKDLNEALLDGDYKAALAAVMNAEAVRPDGIVSMDDIIDEAMKPIERGLPWFLPELTEMTYGRRWGEVYGLGAPTGGGKTDLLTEQIAFDINTLGQKVGALFLEQKPTETAKRLAGKVGNRRFHVPDDGWTLEELRESLEPFRGMIQFYDSWGACDWDEVKATMRHMHFSEGIKIFYLDHLTALADTSDEKGSLEEIMKQMAGFANELQIMITFVSHLTTPDGTPHEEGGRIAVRHFKGSRAIGFWSYFMFGLERDQQAEDEEERHKTTFRILKDRYTGQATGHTFHMGYDAEHGRIVPPSEAMFQTPDIEGF